MQDKEEITSEVSCTAVAKMSEKLVEAATRRGNGHAGSHRLVGRGGRRRRDS